LDPKDTQDLTVWRVLRVRLVSREITVTLEPPETPEAGVPEERRELRENLEKRVHPDLTVPMDLMEFPVLTGVMERMVLSVLTVPSETMDPRDPREFPVTMVSPDLPEERERKVPHLSAKKERPVSTVSTVQMALPDFRVLRVRQVPPGLMVSMVLMV